LLLADPTIENPFYLLAPDWALYPLIGWPPLAAVIASQAVISGVFSVTRQAVQLGYLPRMDIQHTSSKEIGQIYIPSMNWSLLGRHHSAGADLPNFQQPGLCLWHCRHHDHDLRYLPGHVCGVTLWGWKPASILSYRHSLPGRSTFAFFGATSLKIVQGGWVPLIIGVLMVTVMSTWKRGRNQLFERLSHETMPLNLFVNSIGGGSVQDGARHRRVHDRQSSLCAACHAAQYETQQNPA
jgi:KUP system potassium uptake protein